MVKDYWKIRKKLQPISGPNSKLILQSIKLWSYNSYIYVYIWKNALEVHQVCHVDHVLTKKNKKLRSTITYELLKLKKIWAALLYTFELMCWFEWLWVILRDRFTGVSGEKKSILTWNYFLISSNKSILDLFTTSLEYPSR